jgi:hypothetical protein
MERLSGIGKFVAPGERTNKCKGTLGSIQTETQLETRKKHASVAGAIET